MLRVSQVKLGKRKRAEKYNGKRGKGGHNFLFSWREEASFKRDFPKSKRKLLPFFISSYTNNEYFHFVRWLSCQVRVPTKRNKEKMKAKEKKKMKDRVKKFVFPRVLLFLFYCEYHYLKKRSWYKSRNIKCLKLIINFFYRLIKFDLRINFFFKFCKFFKFREKYWRRI